MCGTTAVRATKSFGPAGALQHRSVKCFGVKELVELRQRQAGLKLNAVDIMAGVRLINPSA
jgi:hypothetical protein